MIRQLEEMLRDLQYSERKATVTEQDKTKFTLLLEEPLKLNLISADDASDLITMVENGQLPLLQAYALVKEILEDFRPQIDKEARTQLPKLLKTN